ncbi:hypothetical protein ACQ4LE_010651, partial [Meloidogyne hapla]
MDNSTLPLHNQNVQHILNQSQVHSDGRKNKDSSSDSETNDRIRNDAENIVGDKFNKSQRKRKNTEPFQIENTSETQIQMRQDSVRKTPKIQQKKRKKTISLSKLNKKDLVIGESSKKGRVSSKRSSISAHQHGEKDLGKYEQIRNSSETQIQKRRDAGKKAAKI